MEFYTPMISDWDNFENWEKNGSITTLERANKTWKTLLKQYEQPTLDPSINEALIAFVVKRKEEINNSRLDSVINHDPLYSKDGLLSYGYIFSIFSIWKLPITFFVGGIVVFPGIKFFFLNSKSEYFFTKLEILFLKFFF